MLALVITLLAVHHAASTFQPTNRHCRLHRPLQDNFFGDLWEEVIEFSTLGPSERKLLKARRAKKKESTTVNSSFREARNKFEQTEEIAKYRDNHDEFSLEEFNAARKRSSVATTTIPADIDGYALRDLMIEKWGVPLDIDFQRQPGSIYCAVLPVAFGSKKCRHESELDYLMHLQGVVEILQRYDNLELFLGFLKATVKIPKVGTDSVPFRMQLSEEQLENILG